MLDYFSASADEYTVIFTSGCTAALKLLAETFDYHGDCCYDNCVCNFNQGSQSRTHVTCKRGSFSYLQDNHTSVQGMREIAFGKAGKVQCIDCNNEDQQKVLNVLHEERSHRNCGNHLFAFPAQSNFSGRKYPLQWITMVTKGQLRWQQSGGPSQGTFSGKDGLCDTNGSRSEHCNGNWYTVLDAASLVSTSPLDLSVVKPDFVTISFYKMFGIPTGLGRFCLELCKPLI